MVVDFMREAAMRLAFICTVAVAIAACGGDTVSSPTPSSSNPNAPGGNPQSPTAAQVSVMEYSFSPQTASIKVGTSVTWTDNGSLAHTATADGGAFNSGQISAASGGGSYGGGSGAGSYTFTFTAAGTYTYHCANHPTLMSGTITVTP